MRTHKLNINGKLSTRDLGASKITIGAASAQGLTVDTNDLVVSDPAGNAAINLFCATDKYGSIVFASETGTQRGMIRYRHTSDDMLFYAGNVLQVTIESDGDVKIGDNTLFVDAVNNRVGINQGTPTYPLDITGKLYTSGILYCTDKIIVGTTATNTYHASANYLIVYNATNAGMTIHSDSAAAGSIHFANSSSGSGAYSGDIVYDHTTEYMGFYTGSVLRMKLYSTYLKLEAGMYVKFTNYYPYDKIVLYTGYTIGIESGTMRFVVPTGGHIDIRSTSDTLTIDGTGAWVTGELEVATEIDCYSTTIGEGTRIVYIDLLAYYAFYIYKPIFCWFKFYAAWGASVVKLNCGQTSGHRLIMTETIGASGISIQYWYGISLNPGYYSLWTDVTLRCSMYVTGVYGASSYTNTTSYFLPA